MYECDTCNRTFRTQQGCEQHIDDTDHWARDSEPESVFECNTGNREFASQEASNQHMSAKGHWHHQYKCETCHRKFYTQAAVKQHKDALGHWTPRYDFKCETCNRVFGTQGGATHHMTAKGHWAPRYKCETCDAQFLSPEAANQHMAAKEHWARRREKCDPTSQIQEAADRHMENERRFKHYCAPRKEPFRNEDDLQEHYSTKIHLGNSQCFKCPICQKADFSTASSLANHLVAHQLETPIPAAKLDQSPAPKLLIPALKSAPVQVPLTLASNTPVPAREKLPPAPKPLRPAALKPNIQAKTPLAQNRRWEQAFKERLREMIDTTIRERDPNRVVTKAPIEPRKPIEHEKRIEPPRKRIEAEKDIEPPRNGNVSCLVTKRSFNGQYWECFLCNKLFIEAGHLEQHLNSTEHKDSEFE